MNESFGEQYDIKDMSKDTEGTEPKNKNIKNKVIKLYSKNTEWKEGKTKKGGKMLYRKYNDKFVNVGFFKTGHVWLTYDGAFVKDHGIKNISDEQVKKDIDDILDLIVNIAN